MHLDRMIVPGSGVPLNCYVAGEGPPMIMLHGHPDCGYGWINQIEYFSDRFRIVAPDLRGCGFSGKPQGVDEYTIGTLIRDLAAVVDHFDMQDVTYVGHDWGGIIGWYYTAYHPGRIGRLVTICAPHPAEYVRALTLPGQQQAAAYIRSILETGVFDVALDTFAVRFPERNVLAAFQNAMRETDYRAVANYYCVATRQSPTFPLAGIPKVTVPVLNIYARNDPAIIEQAYAYTGRWLGAPVRSIALDLATHFPHQESAGAVNAEIEKWLWMNS